MGKPLNDLTGRVFSKITVLGRHPDNYRGKARWFCLCECGIETVVVGSGLISGNTTSCGCHQRTVAITHGCASPNSSKHYLYAAFKSARRRCNNPADKEYHNYGGRGIRWLFTSFQRFVDEIGERPSKGHSVDRIDGDKHYEPGNVKWSTALEQTLNRRCMR